MTSQVSIGDVLMLSHTARGVGKVFAITGDDIPQQFSDVDCEIQGLADALKLLAYTLEDDNVLLQCSIQVRSGLHLILSLAQSTLRNLTGFVDRYSLTQHGPHDEGTSGDFPTWDTRVLSEWGTLPWTEDGGDILSLRSLLIMHCSTITLTTQVLQSKSIEHLESTIMPLADKLTVLRQTRPVQLDKQLQELHYLCLELTAAARPVLESSTDEPFSPKILDFDMSFPVSPAQADGFDGIRQLSADDSSPQSTTVSSHYDASHISKHFSMTSSEKQGPLLTTTVEVSEAATKRHPTSNRTPLPIKECSRERPQSQSGKQKRRDSLFRNTRPSNSHDLNDTTSFRSVSVMSNRTETAEHESLHRPAKRSFTNSRMSMIIPGMVRWSDRRDSHDLKPHDTRSLRSVVRRSTYMRTSSASESSTQGQQPRQETATEVYTQGRSLRTDFVNELLKDSVKMFDARALSVQGRSATGTTGDKDTRTLSESCRVLVVRKKGAATNEGFDWSTSIWIIAEDLSVRLEQALPHTAEAGAIAPFQDASKPERIVLDMPGTIKYHPVVWGNQNDPQQESFDSNRTAFTFASPISADAFQSTIFGHVLLESFKIEKATVVSTGPTSLFRGMSGGEEEICGSQRLRVWKGQDDALPTNESARIMALMNLRSGYGLGWLKWDVTALKPSQLRNKSGHALEIRGLDLKVPLPTKSDFYNSGNNCSTSSIVMPAGRLGEPSEDRYIAQDPSQKDQASSGGRPSSSRSMRSGVSFSSLRLPNTFRNRTLSRDRSVPLPRPVISAPVGGARPLPAPVELFSAPDMAARRASMMSMSRSTDPSTSSGDVLDHIDPLRSLPPALTKAAKEQLLQATSPTLGGKWGTPISPRMNVVPKSPVSTRSHASGRSQNLPQSPLTQSKSNDTLFAEVGSSSSSGTQRPPPSSQVLGLAATAPEAEDTAGSSLWTQLPPKDQSRIDSLRDPDTSVGVLGDERVDLGRFKDLQLVPPPEANIHPRLMEYDDVDITPVIEAVSYSTTSAHQRPSLTPSRQHHSASSVASVTVRSASQQALPLRSTKSQSFPWSLRQSFQLSTPSLTTKAPRRASEPERQRGAYLFSRSPSLPSQQQALRPPSSATMSARTSTSTYTPMRSVQAIKLYFSGEAERSRFVALVKRVAAAERDRVRDRQRGVIGR